MLLKVHKNLLDKQSVIDLFNKIYDKHFEEYDSIEAK